jgi:exodeoxyribonuclease VII small subunit
VSDMKFEEALDRLEHIVQQLEEGSLGLDDSLKIFEEGIKLTHFCTKKLTESEARIQVLVKTAGGEKSLQPFEVEEEPFLQARETDSKNEESLP